MGWVQHPQLAGEPAGGDGSGGPCARKGAALAYCAATSSLYVFGGMAEGRRLLADLWRLRMDTAEWAQVGLGLALGLGVGCCAILWAAPAA